MRERGESEPRSAPMLERAAYVCAGLMVLLGSVVFLGGWWLDVAALKNLIPGAATMKASTANALTFSGYSLALLINPAAGRLRRGAGYAAALYPLFFGIVFVCEYVFSWRLGLDEILFTDHAGRTAGVQYPGRPAPATAVCLILTGLALLTLNVRPHRNWRASEILSSPVAAVAWMSLIGYTYSIPAFYGPSSAAKMAIHTAIGFVILVLGILLARPRGQLLALATTEAPGGMMARRLIPFVILFPLVLGWLRLRAGDAGVFDGPVGTWWLTAATIAGMLLLLWRAAARLNKADEVRKALEARLFELANHDQMTGLFNRHRFEEELAKQAHRSRRHGGATSVAMIDLDRLKEVNDGLGHAAGDDLIRAVADAITGRVRVTDVVGRLGGDEFAVLTGDATSEGTSQMADDLVVAIRSAMPARGTDAAWSTVSVGTAFSAEPLADDGSELLGKADEAMYIAKRAGGNRTAVSEPSFPGLRQVDSVAP